MANVNISLVTLSNTFDEWRTRSNDLISDRNILRNSNYVKDAGNFVVNDGTLRISKAGGGTTLTNDNDALILGVLTANVVVVQNPTGTGLTVISDSLFSGNVAVSKNVSIANTLTVGTNANVAGILNVSTRLDVSGNTLLFSNAYVGQNTTLNGTLTVAGNTTLSSNLTVSRNATITGNLLVSTDETVSGNLTVGQALIVSNLVIGTVSNYAASSLTTTATTQVNLDSFVKTTYRTAKYIVQAFSSTTVHSSEVLLTHDGTTAYMTEYATLRNGASLYTLAADINVNDVRLRVTPASATSTVFRLAKTALTT
jgi:hypothetical protein